MLGFLTNWAINKADRIMDSRPPDFAIGPADDPYMLRWWAIGALFSIACWYFLLKWWFS